MPKKSKRVASRQAQLSGRGRRARLHGPTGIPTRMAPHPVSTPPSEDGAPTEANIEQTPAEPQWSSRQQDTAPAATPSPRPRGRAMARPSPATYFGAEMRRIGLLSGLILALLITLIFVLQ